MSFNLAQDRESFELAQDCGSFDVAQDRGHVEGPVEPFRVSACDGLSRVGFVPRIFDSISYPNTFPLIALVAITLLSL